MRRIYWFAFALLALLPGCEKTTEVSVLDVSPTEIYLSESVNTQTCDISSSSPWTATCDAGWIELDKTTGTKGTTSLTVQLSGETASEWTPQATITLRNEDGKTADITVTYDDPNVILYTTTDQKMLDLGNSFNAYDIESHTYGRIRFYNPVKKIPERAFSRKTTLASISMPHGVESIGDEAFYHCDALTQVTIPNSVTSIGSSAFSGCDALTQVTIPNSVTSIEDRAFASCEALTQVTIPNSVTSIGDYAFYSCDALTQVTIPDGVTSFGDYVFQYCSALEQVTIGNSVTSIGEGAFSRCSALTQVTIGNGVTSVGSSAFSDCSSLTQVTWNAINCTDFNSYYDNVGPFYDSRFNITSFTFGNQVEHIPAYLCYGMDKLTQVTIPNSVTSIGYWAFSGCSALTEVTWNAINYADFKYSDYSPFYYIRSNITNFTFGNQVEHIPAYLCYGMDKLTQVTLPDGVTSIGDRAFYDCSALTQVSIPDGVTSIGDYAFYDCSALTQVSIPDSVTSIGDDAFFGCSALTQVAIGNSVTSIGDWAFGHCTQLETVFCKPENPPTLGQSAFFDTNLKTIYVPRNSVQSYKNEWNDYKDEIIGYDFN